MDSVESSKNCPREHGYTLVEVMVAALILGLGIMGAISMLRMAREMEYSVHLQRQARLLAVSALERPLYQATVNWPIVTGPVPPQTGIVLDAQPNPDLTATLSINIGESISDWPPGNEVVSHKIMATVTWDLDGVTNSVSVSKRISQIKRAP